MRKPIISVLLLAAGVLSQAAAMPPTASTDDFQPTFAAVPGSVVASPAATCIDGATGHSIPTTPLSSCPRVRTGKS